MFLQKHGFKYRLIPIYTQYHIGLWGARYDIGSDITNMVDMTDIDNRFNNIDIWYQKLWVHTVNGILNHTSKFEVQITHIIVYMWFHKT